MRCGGIFDLPAHQSALAALEAKRNDPAFWEDHTAAAAVNREISSIEALLATFGKAGQGLADLTDLWELLQAENYSEDSTEYVDFVKELGQVSRMIEQLEIESLLDGAHDNQAAIVTIHAGAGGVDSCDWAAMLLRMYLMWAQTEKLDVTLLDEKEAEEAGIQSATIRVSGRHAYGYLKVEDGVHRLVRLSPFDNAHRRHTSFASVDVIPELEELAEIEIDEDDLKMDVYRSSSAGGQHVNKTSSAVRLTHLPTGIIVACQNERSQHQNKEMALKMLKSRLAVLLEQQHKERIDELRGTQSEIAWGNQIRSYVLHPYQMVKDLRTGYETSNAQRVLDGELTPFIWAGLRTFRTQRSAK
jgi:peptide chain release factor 2